LGSGCNNANLDYRRDCSPRLYQHITANNINMGTYNYYPNVASQCTSSL